MLELAKLARNNGLYWHRMKQVPALFCCAALDAFLDCSIHGLLVFLLVLTYLDVVV